jgi:glucose/arabinose dehydrogenase
MKKLFFFVLVIFLLVVGVFFFKTPLAQQISQYLFHPTDTAARPGVSNSGSSPQPLSSSNTPSASNIEVVADHLHIPWEVVFLPDQSLLVTERPGQLVRIFPNDKKTIPVSGVEHVGEGGLMGMALHPQFSTNHFIYLYHTTKNGKALTNQLEQYVFNEQQNQLTDKKILMKDIPASANHDGGRVAFGPDGLLYFTAGDAEHPENAQRTNSPSGKILRLKDDGSIPADNPFGNAVYSYGHRNPQGLAWDATGQLWATEHGPSGLQTGNDEVNIIEKGKNYGWPTIKGDQTHEGMVSPVIQSGTKETWAPAGTTIIDGKLFFVGLRGESVYSADIQGQQLSNLTAHFRQGYGRLRVVTLDPTQQWVYIATSNTDGRGPAKADDDKIIRIKKELFFQ